MLKTYQIGTHLYQFEEGTQPASAVEWVKPKEKAKEPENKAQKPANKAKKASNK